MQMIVTWTDGLDGGWYSVLDMQGSTKAVFPVPFKNAIISSRIHFGDWVRLAEETGGVFSA